MTIHNVYVFRKSGEPLVHVKIGSIEADPCLVTGLLSAIYSFTLEITKKRLKSITVEDCQFVVLEDKDSSLIFAACVDFEESVIDIQKRLKDIKRLFTRKYKDINYVGDVTFFKPFEKEIKEVMFAPPINIDGSTLLTVKEKLKEMSELSEIQGCALYSATGKPILSIQIPKNIEVSLLKRIEGLLLASSTFQELKPVLIRVEKFPVIVIGSDLLILAVVVQDDESVGVASIVAEEYLKKIDFTIKIAGSVLED
ncbi:MAG: hypothetical protein Q6368_007490 [Candidatus Baldrarchaeota archaeon]|nr:hypothetical protein [Candidatus Baldrarchaeota archaeon]